MQRTYYLFLLGALLLNICVYICIPAQHSFAATDTQHTSAIVSITANTASVRSDREEILQNSFWLQGYFLAITQQGNLNKLQLLVNRHIPRTTGDGQGGGQGGNANNNIVIGYQLGV